MWEDPGIDEILVDLYKADRNITSKLLDKLLNEFGMKKRCQTSGRKE